MKKPKQDEDLKSLCELLINYYPKQDKKNRVLKMLKFANSNNSNKLKAKEIKEIFKDLAKKAKTKNKANCKEDYHKQVLSVAKILNWKGDGAKWVIKDLLPQNGITILSGSPASYKTWSTLHYALCIAEGLLVYGHFETIKASVLIVDEEDGIGLLQQRLKILSANSKVHVYFRVMSGFKIDQEDKVAMLLEQIKKYHIKVIIIDSLVRIHSGDENSSNDMKKVFEVFRVFNTKGITILVNHHHGKGGDNENSDSMRGSSDILAAIDCQMKIKHKNNQLEITQKKNRISQELKPFKVDVINENNKITFSYAGDDTKTQDKINKDKETILTILRNNGGWMSRIDIEEQITDKLGGNKIGEILSLLSNEYDIEVDTKAKGKKLYRARPIVNSQE